MNDQPNPKGCVVLCPGQGAQSVGMGKAWFDGHQTARQTFEEADRELGIPLSQLCFEGPADELNRTDIAQAAIYTTSVACYRCLAESGAISEINAAAGLSLGEFTALHLAGVFDFLTGLRLVRLRGQSMQAAAEASSGSMVALVGADEAQASELCDKARGNDILVPANFNCPGQVVVSGSKPACDRAEEVAKEMGLRASALSVAGAFHSPLMEPAAQQLAQALDEVQWQAADAAPVTVVSNVTACPHENDPAAIKTRLIEQLTKPVRWSESIQWLIQQSQGPYIELAPGKVLSGLMRRIDRKTKVQNHDRPAEVTVVTKQHAPT